MEDNGVLLVICIVLLLMFFGGVVFLSAKAQKQKKKDAQEPIRRRFVRILDKPQAARGEMISVAGPIVFEFESGERVQLLVSASEYATIMVGDVGELTYQGSKYLGFKREV